MVYPDFLNKIGCRDISFMTFRSRADSIIVNRYDSILADKIRGRKKVFE